MKNAMNRKSRFASLIPVVLIAAMVLSLAACGGADDGNTNAGTKAFTFTAWDTEGKATVFELESSAATVGEALITEGIIAGEDGAYGLYVKTVNGITLDYDTHGMYWAFYVGEEYGAAGVDQTELTDGGVYAFKPEK